jgi:hypothetical protein
MEKKRIARSYVVSLQYQYGIYNIKCGAALKGIGMCKNVVRPNYTEFN